MSASEQYQQNASAARGGIMRSVERRIPLACEHTLMTYHLAARDPICMLGIRDALNRAADSPNLMHSAAVQSSVPPTKARSV
jgi:hypothetical protein